MAVHQDSARHQAWFDAIDLTDTSVPVKKAGLKIANPLLSSAMISWRPGQRPRKSGWFLDQQKD
jgi:hypothetical protein